MQEETWNELIPSDEHIQDIHWVYLSLGLFITVFGLFSLVIKDRLFVSEAFMAAAAGVVLSFLNVLDVDTQFGMAANVVTLEFTRVVLVIQCMAAGVSTPGTYVAREWKSLALLLGPVMLYMWLISALGIYVILGLSWTDSLIAAACITPTDPVLANSIMKGAFAEKHVPYHVRLLLSAESAVNDGLGTPMLLLPLYLTRVSPIGVAVGDWIWKVVLYQVAVSIVLGIVIGFVARHALQYSEKNGLIDKESMLSFTIALALLISGGLSLLGMDDILASFIAGTVVTWDSWFNRQTEESHIQEVLDNLINVMYFIFLGSRVRFIDFTPPELPDLYRLFLLAVWILFLRRVPIILALYNWIPAVKNLKEAFFCGWFGPIGAGAIFYAMMAIVYLQVPSSPLIQIVVFMVMSSIVIHGGTVSLFHFGLTTHSTWRTEREARKKLKFERERSESADIRMTPMVTQETNVPVEHVAGLEPESTFSDLTQLAPVLILEEPERESR